jgi:hypothetical protein
MVVVIVEAASEFVGFLSGFDIERRKRKLGVHGGNGRLNTKFSGT